MKSKTKGGTQYFGFYKFVKTIEFHEFEYFFL